MSLLNSTTLNDTLGQKMPGPEFPPLQDTEVIVAVVFFSILIIFIVVGNLLVLASYTINRKLRTTTNTFIVSLASADLIVGALSVPLWCLFLLNTVGLIPQEIQLSGVLYAFWLKLDIFAGVSSVNHLTAISIERAYALLFPLRHRRIRKRFIVLTIVLAWIMSAGVAALHYHTFAVPLTYALIVTSCFYFFPLMMILASYAVIFKVARSSIEQYGNRNAKKDFKIAITIAFVVGVFVICWLPFHTLNIVLPLCMTRFCPLDFERMIIAVKVGHYSNSAINPMIYGFRNKEFSKTFKRIFFYLICRRVPSTYYQDTKCTRVQTQAKMAAHKNLLSVDDSSRDSYIKAIDRGDPENKVTGKLFKKENDSPTANMTVNFVKAASPVQQYS